MKTYQTKTAEIKRKEHVLDAEGQVLGRFASRIATLLIGKHKPEYTAHADNGDMVIVKNAKKIVVTGQKEKQKVYQKHSNYPGGFKEVAMSKLRAEQPEKIIELAVSRMLPKNKLLSKRMRRLKFEK